MIFDEKFMGLLNLLGGMKKPINQEDKNGMGFENLTKMLGMIEAFKGFGNNSDSRQNNAFGQTFQNSEQNNASGIDMSKILPLMSLLKGQNLTANPFALKKDEVQQQSFDDVAKGGYKDKFHQIAFAGNEVIYAVGELWKTKR